MLRLRRVRGLAVVAVVTLAAAACTSSGSSNKVGHSTLPSSSTTSAGGTTGTGSGGTTGSATTETTSPPLAAVLPVSWHGCTAAEGPAGGADAADQCASLQVPLDYSQPGATKIGIALARRPATGTKTGSLLFNPGGPGASGIDDLDYVVGMLPSSILSHFDVVAFDPRGVSRSAPVHCASGSQLDQFVHANPAPTTAAGLQALVAVDQTFVNGCVAKSGAELGLVGTANAARDMDEIRSAVGDAKLTYLGFSYGTFLGATYAELFPSHIRAMVLDGAIDPALDAVTSDIVQAAAFDKNLQDFFTFCTQTPDQCSWHPGGDLTAAYNALLAHIAASPLRVSGTSRTVGSGEAFYGIAEELYSQTTWPDLASALQQAESGNGSQLLQSSDQYTGRNPDGTYSNELESNNAIACDDQPWPKSLAMLQQDAVQAKQKAPEFGVADLYGGIPCSLWPTTPTSTPRPISAAGSPPIVVVGSTGDPATPYTDAQSLAKELQHGVLLTRVGDGHTGYSFSACIRQYVDNYFANLVVPPVGTTCPTSS
ncbi:MAG: alpha/beta hydrolase [Acidimicrobiales bacterium]